MAGRPRPGVYISSHRELTREDLVKDKDRFYSFVTNALEKANENDSTRDHLGEFMENYPVAYSYFEELQLDDSTSHGPGFGRGRRQKSTVPSGPSGRSRRSRPRGPAIPAPVPSVSSVPSVPKNVPVPRTVQKTNILGDKW